MERSRLGILQTLLELGWKGQVIRVGRGGIGRRVCQETKCQSSEGYIDLLCEFSDKIVLVSEESFATSSYQLPLTNHLHRSTDTFTLSSSQLTYSLICSVIRIDAALRAVGY